MTTTLPPLELLRPRARYAKMRGIQRLASGYFDPTPCRDTLKKWFHEFGVRIEGTAKCPYYSVADAEAAMRKKVGLQ